MIDSCKLLIDNWRWAGVPFYLRTGKYMGERATQIAIRFRQAPFALFRNTPVESLNPNWMILRIQPDEGISLRFATKHPGPSVQIAGASMDFAYKDRFESTSSTGYETLLYDCMIGDATLFQRADNVEAGWQVVQPILDAWANSAPGDFPNYRAGSEGPDAADELLRATTTPGFRSPAEPFKERNALAKTRKISLVLADVDGTLVNEDKVLTERAQAAVRRLHDAGIRFAITSGRPPRGLSMLYDPLRLDTPIARYHPSRCQ